MPTKPKVQFPFVAVALAAAVGLFLVSGAKLPTWGPTPTPVAPDLAPRPGDPDLFAEFAMNPDKAEAKRHAAELCEVSRATAEALRFDGSQLPAERRISAGVHVSAMRNDIRHFAMRGLSFTAKYPALKAKLADYLDQTAGRGAEDLSPEQREKWAAAHEAIARAAYAAEGKL